MLRKLTIENFYSFKEAQVFDLSIARNATDPDGRFAKPLGDSEERFPKVVAVFGANASGKTNLLRAVSFFRHFTVESADWPRDRKIPFLNFSSEEFWALPTRFRVEFDAAAFGGEGRKRFLYGLEIAPDFKTVTKESLYYIPFRKRRLLFHRIGNSIDAGRDFGLPKRDPVRGKLRSNASVISTLAQFNHPPSVSLFEDLKKVQINWAAGSGTRELSGAHFVSYYENNDGCLRELEEFIGKLDFGIEAIDLRRGPAGSEVRFRHRGLDDEVQLSFESQGTINFFRTYPAIWHALQTGTIVAMDELDNDIHPLVLPEIVRQFQNPETNPRNAQLIMSCHNATLLEYLEKEEVFLTEKTADGSTTVVGLSQIQGVRRDTNLYSKYLAGAFGGIPRVA